MARTVRLWIIDSIRQILAGEEFTLSDWERQPHEGWGEIEPKTKRRLFLRLDRQHPAYFAWVALQWWVNDDDIRAKDPQYGEMRKRQLQELLDRIEPDEEAVRNPNP
jgi:hypothetical protein